jgi:hypothetical protein
VGFHPLVIILTCKDCRDFLGLDPETGKICNDLGNDLWDRGENHIKSNHLVLFSLFGGSADAKVKASMKAIEYDVMVKFLDVYVIIQHTLYINSIEQICRSYHFRSYSMIKTKYHRLNVTARLVLMEGVRT